MNRKMRFTAGLLLAVFFLYGCGNGGAPKRYEAQFLDLFDTMTKVAAYSRSREEFEKQAEMIRDTLMEYHRLYDIYTNYEGVNNIKTINDNAGRKAVKVDRRIIGLLRLGRRMYEETGGRVNIAMGSVLSVWHDYRTEGIDNPKDAKLPPLELLEEAAAHTDIGAVVIDEEASTVYLRDPLMSLDVGAIGKGYAAEQTCLLAQEKGMDSLLLSVGGNVRSVGTRGDKSAWRVGIEDPGSGEGGYLFAVELSDCALVTSGDYQRYYTVKGKTYHHIINPDTLMPPDYFSAVTILCRDSGAADALSTAVFNMPLEEGQAFVESLADTEAMWIGKDGVSCFSSGFPRQETERAANQ